MVRVLGKGGKERLVPFNTSTATAIRAYLKDRERSVWRRRGGRPRPAGRRRDGRADASAIRCS